MAFNGRGYAWMRLGQYQKAIADFTEAIRLNPKYANAYQNRAAAYRALGQTAQADEDLAKAVALSTR
jgi:tetratricopeptide (TPR) repeat protein